MDQDTFPRYPEVALLPRRPEIMSVKEVIATEKLHGSNFRVHFPLGMASVDDVQFGSRDVVHVPGVDGFPLGGMMRWFKERPELLGQMWEVVKSYGFGDTTVFGEAHGPGVKAKGVKYSGGQGFLFRAFDVMVGNNFLTYDHFVEVTDKMGLPRVPEVWRGPPSVEAFDALLEKRSPTAFMNGVEDEANKAEGVVIRSNPLLRNVFGEWLIVKHKASKFSEVAHAPAEKRERSATPADGFAETYVTEGRVLNATGRLHDRGLELKNSMADMPVLLAEVIYDVLKEHGPEWKALGLPDKQLTGAVSKVLGPLYRRMTASG